jgi:hypothetical protein
MAIWNIYRHLGYFLTIWYILCSFIHFSGFGIMCEEKSGNPDQNRGSWRNRIFEKCHAIKRRNLGQVAACSETGTTITPGSKCDPGGEVCHQGREVIHSGWSPYVGPCVNRGQSRHPWPWGERRGWTFPLGNKVHPWGAKFLPRGQTTPLEENSCCLKTASGDTS